MKKILAILFSFFSALFAHAQNGNSTGMTSEASFRGYFTKHITELNPIEGIWQVSSKQYYYKEDTLYDVIEAKKAARVAIIEKDGKFLSYIITGELYNVEFTKTDVAGVYFYRNYFKETNEYSKTSAVISKAGEMKYEYEIPEKLTRIKMADLFEEGIRVNNEVEWEKVFPLGKEKK